MIMSNVTDKRFHSRIESNKGHKTPYEIRTELLELAYRILRDRNGESNLYDITTEDVIAEATKLNKFISQG